MRNDLTALIQSSLPHTMLKDTKVYSNLSWEQTDRVQELLELTFEGLDMNQRQFPRYLKKYAAF